MRNVVSCLIALALLAPAASAQGQDRPMRSAEKPEAVARLFACRDVADPAERLSCFEREVAAVEKAQADEELVIVDREQVREARRGLFGFNLPRIGLFGGGDDRNEVEEIEEIEAPIASFALRGGKGYFTLEDGARWIQTDSTPILGKVVPGDMVLIKRAALGSYLAKIGSKRGFRVERLN